MLDNPNQHLLFSYSHEIMEKLRNSHRICLISSLSYIWITLHRIRIYLGNPDLSVRISDYNFLIRNGTYQAYFLRNGDIF